MLAAVDVAGWVTTFLTGAKVPGFCEGGVYKETKRVDFCSQRKNEILTNRVLTIVAVNTAR